MRAVVDVVAALLVEIDRVADIEHRIQDGRHRQEIDAQQRPRLQQDVGEQHRRHRAGRAKRGIAGIIAVWQGRGQHRYHDAAEVEDVIAETAEVRPEETLHDLSEKKQGDHVEQQVHEIGMHEAVAQVRSKTILAPRLVGIKQPAFKEGPVLETDPGNQAGERDDDEISGQLHVFHLIIAKSLWQIT